MRSFEDLQKIFSLNKTQFHKYLQIRHALLAEVQTGDNIPEYSPMEARALMENLGRGGVSQIYRTLIAITACSLGGLRQRWEGWVGPMEEVDWNEALAAPHTITMTTRLRLIQTYYLHAAYLTPARLHRAGLRPTADCPVVWAQMQTFSTWYGLAQLLKPTGGAITREISAALQIDMGLTPLPLLLGIIGDTGLRRAERTFLGVACLVAKRDIGGHYNIGGIRRLPPCRRQTNTPRRRREPATAIMTHITESAEIQTPTQYRHTKGTRRNVTTPEGPDNTTPPPEEAHSDDSSSALLDLDEQPGPSWASGQSVSLAQPQPNTELPPSGNTSTAPTQRAHTSLPRKGQSAVCPPLQGTQANPTPQQQQGPGGSGSGHTVQGTEAQEHRGTGRAAVRQRVGQAKGTYSQRGPLLHHGSIPPLPGDDGNGPGQVAGDPASAGGAVFGVQGGAQDHRLRPGHHCRGADGHSKDLEDTVALQGAPDTSQDDEIPTTSAGASGQDAPPQDQHTSTPPPADGQPPRKWSLRSRNRTEQDGKTPARK
ncbi:hypothetical protein NDU88_001257 [Pleurodeles waltl]|uniref:Uncharacterized protein n=1 Tax=Pleurodeles waltl TaxID=8319 RepID=A0AAV7VZY7_PLEWA|nr:hypothetical protein NDU88_001257 [Pleurodeles waltl]